MDHLTEIACQRIKNLHSGIENAETKIKGIQQMLDNKEPIESVQKELQEINDFLVWLDSQ